MKALQRIVDLGDRAKASEDSDDWEAFLEAQRDAQKQFPCIANLIHSFKIEVSGAHADPSLPSSMLGGPETAERQERKVKAPGSLRRRKATFQWQWWE